MKLVFCQQKTQATRAAAATTVHRPASPVQLAGCCRHTLMSSGAPARAGVLVEGAFQKRIGVRIGTSWDVQG